MASKNFACAYARVYSTVPHITKPSYGHTMVNVKLEAYSLGVANTKAMIVAEPVFLPFLIPLQLAKVSRSGRFCADNDYFTMRVGRATPS